VDSLAAATLELLGSPWLLPAVFALTVLDAFLVVVPSETVLVALGALALSGHGPDLPLLIAVAAVAAAVGDNLTYLVGRVVRPERIALLRRPLPARALARARRELDRRAAVVLLTARFVPFGRIAVNLTAGATRFPRSRFVPLSVVTGAAWAVYNALVGAAVGALLGDPVLAVVVSVGIAIALGLLVDAATTRLAARAARRAVDAQVGGPGSGAMSDVNDPLRDGTIPADADLRLPSDGMQGTTQEDPSDATTPDGDDDEQGVDRERRSDTPSGALSPGTSATGEPTGLDD
jgi:membrane-associated protein